MSRIAVVGCWHQGTVLSACLADLGHDVVGVPDGEQAAQALGLLRPPVHEPGPAATMRRAARAGRLRFTVDYEEAVEDADLVYLSFDTPIEDDDRPDLSPLYEAASRIGRALRRGTVLVVTSQVPVGTSVELLEHVRRESGIACGLAYVPEFLQLGRAVQAFRRADRIVIGADDDAVAERVAELYGPLRCPIMRTGIRAAEMAKHACNAFLAVSIVFANEIADTCELLGVDVTEVVEVMRADRRIGPRAFLSPGLGFAGGTLGRDLRALQELSRAGGKGTPLVDTVLQVNEQRPALVLRWLEDAFGDVRGLEVGILGLTYKPGTSTLRRSMALRIIRDLASAGATVRVFDPLADLDSVPELPPFRMCEDVYETGSGADAVVLLTEWPELVSIDLERLRRSMRSDFVLDTRNFFDPVRMRRAGFRYLAIGRGYAMENSCPPAAGATSGGKARRWGSRPGAAS